MIRFALLIIILFLSGCNEKETIREVNYVYIEVEQDGACTYSSCGEDIIEPIEPVEPPEEPIEETEPDVPIEIPEPVTLPEFNLNGLVQIDDGEFIELKSKVKHMDDEAIRTRAVLINLDNLLDQLDRTLVRQEGAISSLQKDMGEIKKAVVK